MAYMHIDNLYKTQDILMFKECYAMEKIHGTSAHISFDIFTDKKENSVYDGELDNIYCKVHYYAGGESYEKFISLFDSKILAEKFLQLGISAKTIIYGEAYGGKQQGMKDTYGDTLKFITFEVRIKDSWLAVPQAEEIVKNLGLEFIHYVKLPTKLGFIDGERDSDSIQAIRNGVGEGKKREGIVLRPLIEVTKNNGVRIIAKHKREDFRETKTKREVTDPDKLKILKEANAIAEEWVTIMRLNHVLDKIENPSMQKMREIIIAMQEDIKREGKGEIIWGKQVERAIGKLTAQLTKQYFKDKLKEKK